VSGSDMPRLRCGCATATNAAGKGKSLRIGDSGKQARFFSLQPALLLSV
jgi:hypothetical protein